MLDEAAKGVDYHGLKGQSHYWRPSSPSFPRMCRNGGWGQIYYEETFLQTPIFLCSGWSLRTCPGQFPYCVPIGPNSSFGSLASSPWELQFQGWHLWFSREPWVLPFLTHTLWSAQAWTMRVPYVAQVREKRVMAGSRTQWVDVQKQV